jgi:hypothetical protein
MNEEKRYFTMKKICKILIILSIICLILTIPALVLGGFMLGGIAYVTLAYAAFIFALLSIIFGIITYLKYKKERIGLIASVVGICLLIAIPVLTGWPKLPINNQSGIDTSPTNFITFKKNSGEKTLTVTYVDKSKNMSWGDIKVTLGSATLPTGTVDVGDIIRNCTNSKFSDLHCIQIMWGPNPPFTGTVIYLGSFQ